MADAPVDLSPFRSMIGFSSAGIYIALVSITASTDNGEGSLQNWIEFVDPAIGEFGLSKDWGLPADETDETLLYGYDAYSGSNIGTPFGSLCFVNIARTLRDHPDPERTHLVLDHVRTAVRKSTTVAAG